MQKMTKTKYYLKEKCKNWNNLFNLEDLKKQQKCDKFCIYCKGKNFIRGADVTELVERMRKLNKTYPEQSGKNYIHFNGFSDLIEVVKE
ncbi:MAG: hypothetical protein AABY10_02760 [Nanoarchaeota archaeon]